MTAPDKQGDGVGPAQYRAPVFGHQCCQLTLAHPIKLATSLLVEQTMELLLAFMVHCSAINVLQHFVAQQRHSRQFAGHLCRYVVQ